MFDGKADEVDAQQEAEAFGRLVRAMGDMDHIEPPEPWYWRALATVGGFALGLLALGALGAVLAGLAYAARLGWETGA